MITDFPLLRIAILGSGTGTNAKAIVGASLLDGSSFTVSLVVSTKPDVGLCLVAQGAGIPLAVLDPTASDFTTDLIAVMKSQHVDLLVLAGYNRLLPVEVIQSLGNHVVNIHPALLPAYGGKGMFGRKVHEAVLAAGETTTGATVHWVTDKYDEGSVIEQARIQIKPMTTANELEIEVKKLEHALFPRVLQIIGRKFVQGGQHSTTALSEGNL